CHVCHFFAPLVPCCAMLPALRSGRENGLDAALERLTGVESPERPDTPDLRVTAVRRLPAIAARFTPLLAQLDERLVDALRSRGIQQLYTHQAEAIEHALANRHVVVITPTASGKTLCYNAPVLQAILQDPASRALYLFPTKALAQDQLAELQTLTEILEAISAQSTEQSDTRTGFKPFVARGFSRAGAEPKLGATGLETPGDGAPGTGHQAPGTPKIGVFTYDGDTPQDARRTIRARAHIVLSNPDMLHSGILPHHPRWAKLFENLRFVVIDELHAYRGVFGSHLCNVLRRLRRVCRHYRSDPG